MKKHIKLKGRLSFFTHFSFYLGALLTAVDIAVFMMDVRSGLLLLGYTVFYFGVTISLYIYNKPVIMNELVSFATEYGQIQKRLLRELDLAHAVLDDTGKVVWTNAAFERIVHQEKGYRKSITNLFPTITPDRFPEGPEEISVDLDYGNSNFTLKNCKEVLACRQ